MDVASQELKDLKKYLFEDNPTNKKEKKKKI